MDQPGADRPEQAAMLPGSPAAADHHQLGVFGQVDECRYGPPKEQFAVDLRSIAAPALSSATLIASAMTLRASFS